MNKTNKTAVTMAGTSIKTRPPRDDGGVDTIEAPTKPKLKKPPLYKVVLLNDDYTPMEFVVRVLMEFFNMPRDKADQVMLHIHMHGSGVCGVYSREIAETKVRITLEFARHNSHPLQCTMEEV